MDIRAHLPALTYFYEGIYDWAHVQLFSQDGLYQITIVLFLAIFTLLLTRLIKKYAQKFPRSEQMKRFDSVIQALHVLLFPALLLIFCLGARFFAYSYMGWTNQVLNITVNLLFAYLVIRLISFFFPHTRWMKAITIFILLFTFINILGLRGLVHSFLDRLAFNIGDIHISLLLIIRTIITVAIALWIAISLSRFTASKISKSTTLNASLKVLLTKTTQIVLICIAGIIALNTLGINLTAFAVVGGAIGVGIGFGLQKIVSNLISGFLLLLDKSIKPGDVLEMGDTYGWVKSMSARYITVVTLEGKEHLIPNEDLITQKVINWSFSDRLIRLTVEVGIAYNADVNYAMTLIDEITQKIPRVVTEKPPRVYLKNFGNNAIDLEVGFWISDPENGTDNIRSDIRVAIWEAFCEHHIEIPFPQRDVYIKSMP